MASYLFLYESYDTVTDSVSDCVSYIKDDDCNIIEYTFSFGFETNWVPPELLYKRMMADDNILSFSAYWYEPGCSCLGYANKVEGIQEVYAPDRYYSDILDLEVMISEPPQCYIEMEGDDRYILFPDYIKELHEHLKANPDKREVVQQEIEETAVELGIDTEDQQYEDLVAELQ